MNKNFNPHWKNVGTQKKKQVYASLCYGHTCKYYLGATSVKYQNY